MGGGAGGGVPAGPRVRRAATPLSPPQLFLTVLRAPRPALRYFSTERFLPLLRLRVDDPSGRAYVAAMHQAVFSHLPAEHPDGAQGKAGAR